MTEHDEKCERSRSSYYCGCRERALEAENKILRDDAIPAVRRAEAQFHRAEAAEAEVQRLKEWYGMVPEGSALEQIPILHAEITRLQTEASAAKDEAESLRRQDADLRKQLLRSCDERERLETEASASALQMQTENLRLKEALKPFANLYLEIYHKRGETHFAASIRVDEVKAAYDALAARLEETR